jgi:hypothetical protein
LLAESHHTGHDRIALVAAVHVSQPTAPSASFPGALTGFFMRCYNAAMSGESIVLIFVGILTFAVSGVNIAIAPLGNSPDTKIISLFGWGMIAIGSRAFFAA